MMFEASLVLGCLTLGMDPVLAVSIVDELSGREANAVGVEVARHDGSRGGDHRGGAGVLGSDVPGQRLVAITPDEAAALAAGLMGTGPGDATVRVGLMGIDTTRLASLEAPLDEAFEPCTNLALGERLYLEALGIATASGLTGEDAAREALRSYLGGPGAGPVGTDTVGTDTVEAVWSRRAASERWLAERRTSVVAVRARGEAAGTDGDASAEPVRPGSSIVAWTPRTVPAPAGRTAGRKGRVHAAEARP